MAVTPPGILNINHFSNICPPWNFTPLEKALLMSVLPPLKFVAYLGAAYSSIYVLSHFQLIHLYHKLLLMKTAWYVLRMKDMHSQSPSEP